MTIDPAIWKTSIKLPMRHEKFNDLIHQQCKYMCYQCYQQFHLLDFLKRKIVCCPNCKRADWMKTVFIHKYRYQSLLHEIIGMSLGGI